MLPAQSHQEMDQIKDGRRLRSIKRNYMKRITTALLLQAVLIVALAPATLAQQGAKQPPVAKKVAHTTDIHGYKLKDDYFWLREKTNPEVIKYLEDENAYTEDAMKPTKDLQESLYKEMLGHIKQTDLSVPSRIGEYYYYSRTEEGKQYPYQCRKKGSMQGKEEILLDLNKLAEGHSYLGLGAFRVSDDGNLLAYSTDTNGYRQYTLHVKDLRTGQTLSENIERTGSVVWATDNKTLFYTTEDAVSKRSDKFFRHVVGSDKNELLFDEKDELFDVGAGRSLDKKMIFVASYAKTSKEFRYLPADNPMGEFKVVLPRQAGHEYDVDHYHGQFYITTNKDAKNFRVVTAPINDPSEKNWKTFIAHNPKIKIDGITTFANHLVVSEKEGGLDYLRVIDMKTKKSHRITTDESDYALFIGANPEYNTTTVRFNYQSMVTPSTVYDYDMNTRQRKLLKQQEVPGRLRREELRGKANLGGRARRDESSDLARVQERREVRRHGADAALRLWVLRHFDGADLLFESAGAARSRRDLRAGLHSRRRGTRRRLAAAGPNDAEAEHVLRLHRLRRLPGEEQVHVARSDGDPGRQRRRIADGRGHEYASGLVQSGCRASAVRRCDEHDA